MTAANNGGTSANSNQASVTPAVPALILTKRITAINGVPITGFVSDGVGNDANAYWPAPSSTYLRGGTAATARPGSTVEYTLYFLAVGSGSVTSVVISNVLPAHVTFAPTSYNSLTPTDGGSGNSGMALATSSSAYPTAPTVYLSNAADGDRGTFYAPGVAVSRHLHGGAERQRRGRRERGGQSDHPARRDLGRLPLQLLRVRPVSGDDQLRGCMRGRPPPHAWRLLRYAPGVTCRCWRNWREKK